ncbi:MAG: hypothetical protein WED34_20960 [Planctomycetales bacterium]
MARRTPKSRKTHPAATAQRSQRSATATHPRHEPAVAAPPADVGSGQGVDSGDRVLHARLVLLIAAGISAVWGACLAGLALLTANPVTLNPAQIDAADYVVTAIVSSERPDEIVVETEWKRGRELGTILVENLKEAKAVSGERYLIPLTRAGRDRYRVTETLQAELPPLIYPAVPEAERQLAALLGQARPE